MKSPMIVADKQAEYEVQEVVVIVAALAFVIALGGVALAAVIICGWGRVQSVVMDWLHGKATFVCR